MPQQVNGQGSAALKQKAAMRVSTVLNALKTSTPIQIKNYVDSNYPSLTQPERNNLTELYLVIASVVRTGS